MVSGLKKREQKEREKRKREKDNEIMGREKTNQTLKKKFYYTIVLQYHLTFKMVL